jgi:hypothetical protein
MFLGVRPKQDFLGLAALSFARRNFRVSGKSTNSPRCASNSILSFLQFRRQSAQFSNRWLSELAVSKKWLRQAEGGNLVHIKREEKKSDSGV